MQVAGKLGEGSVCTRPNPQVRTRTLNRDTPDEGRRKT